MNNKTLASIIITLCITSLVVGIFNTAILSKNPKENKKQDTIGSSFKGIFYGGNKIALITLDGAISSDEDVDLFKNRNTASIVKKSLFKAENDSSVKGILLRINSPGGTVAMSQEIYNSILRIRKNKPVVVSMGDVAASGGYYIASAADRIFAAPGTLTGSIGVIMNSFNAQELLNQKLGIKSNVIKSGKYKDIASPYRLMSQDEKQLLQDIINSTYDQFVSAIIEGRVNRKDNYKIAKTDLTTKELRKYADGRIFTGETAKKLGFVDELGGTYDAQKAVVKMAKNKFNLIVEPPLVPYNISTGISEIFYGVSEAIMPNNFLMSSKIPLSAKYPHQPLFVWE